MGAGSRSRPVTRSAFTLVELLVVVSVVALLLAILLPSLSKARKQARSLRCATNLHTLAHAQQMYADEYQGAIPRDIIGEVGELPYAVPLALMLSYEVDTLAELAPQFLKIPTFQCDAFPPDNFDRTGQPLPEQPLDYVVNGFGRFYEPSVSDVPFDAPDPNAWWVSEFVLREPPDRLSQIRNPSGRIYLSEAHRNLPTDGLFIFHDVWRGSHLPRGRHPRVAIDVRHPGGINAGYYDGHVARLLPHTMSDTDWHFPP